MKNLHKICLLSTALVALTGCNSMLEASQNAREGLRSIYNSATGRSTSTTSSVAGNAIKATPSKICQDYYDNSAKAEYDYVYKTITFKGKVENILDGGVSLSNGTAEIIFMTATTDNTVLHRLKKGKSYSFTGEINTLQLTTNFPKKCMIGVVAGSIN
ncbi:hypothetical protein [Actinobacillus porcinus]|uniref:hypothetical protein n=1 Tax=Actinobacillus porcinus TaxID=51048 RepID=UPI002357B69C|nr:hypothetical protein [Actinobacillus porcinus]MCI5763604.1 hypothetical protein [Actinobacillus porcinus]MDY5420581.1 hypothetical protein [Actinobacillus porcinus]